MNKKFLVSFMLVSFFVLVFGRHSLAVADKNSQCYNLSGNGYLAKSWSDPKVWYIDGQNKHWFPSEEIFFSWFGDFSLLKLVKQTTLDSFISGSNVCLKGSKAAVLNANGMSCGDSKGEDGLYSMCKGDSVYFGKIKITNNAYSSKALHLSSSGLQKTYYRVPFGKTIEVESANGSQKYHFTYEETSEKHGAFLRIESTGVKSDSIADNDDSISDSIDKDALVSVEVYDDSLTNNEVADFTVKVDSDSKLSKSIIYVNDNQEFVCGANPCVYQGGPYLSPNNYYPAKIAYYAEAVFVNGEKKKSAIKYLTLSSGDGKTGYYNDVTKPQITVEAQSKFVTANGKSGYDIKMKAIGTDNSGKIAKIKLYRSNPANPFSSPIDTCDLSVSPSTCETQQGFLDLGATYEFWAEAFDPAGNKAVSKKGYLNIPSK